MSTNDESKELAALEAGVEVKRCAKCGRILPVSDFSKRSSASDGRQSYCKECVSEANREKKKNSTVTPKGQRLLSNYLVPTRPSLPEEIAEKPVSKCSPRELMLALKMWGYSGKLTWSQEISLSEI